MALTQAAYKKFRKAMAKEFDCPQAEIDKAVKEGLEMLIEARKANDPLALTLSKVFLPAYLVGFQYWLFARNLPWLTQRK